MFFNTCGLFLGFKLFVAGTHYICGVYNTLCTWLTAAEMQNRKIVVAENCRAELWLRMRFGDWSGMEFQLPSEQQCLDLWMRGEQWTLLFFFYFSKAFNQIIEWLRNTIFHDMLISKLGYQKWMGNCMGKKMIG